MLVDVPLNWSCGIRDGDNILKNNQVYFVALAGEGRRSQDRQQSIAVRARLRSRSWIFGYTNCGGR